MVVSPLKQYGIQNKRGNNDAMMLVLFTSICSEQIGNVLLILDYGRVFRFSKKNDNTWE